MKKILEIDQELDKVLVNICDAALKFSGIQMYASIHSLLAKIQNIPLEESPELEKKNVL